jgi:hypothetical protein
MSDWLNPDTGQYQYGGPSAGGGMNMGGFGSGLGSVIGGFLGMGQNNNPADAGMPYLGQIGSTITPYYQPYINAGNSAMGYMQNTLLPQYQKMFQNPGQFMNQMGQGFQQSPGYQFQVNQALGAANRAAAAGGTLGTPMEQQQIAGTVNNLANQDYYNWMNHAQSMLGMGLNGASGLSQNMFDTGFNASNSLANNLAQALAAQAQMAYAGQDKQNQARASFEGDISNGIGSIVGSFLGG